MLQRTLVLVAIAAGVWTHHSWAGAYKWVDEAGRVHYSERPPAGQAAKPIRLKPSPPARDVSATDPAVTEQHVKDSTSEQTPEEAKPTPAEESEETARQALAENQRKNCSAAKANLQRLQAGRRVTAKSADGEEYFLDDAEREARVAEATARIRANCQ